MVVVPPWLTSSIVRCLGQLSVWQEAWPLGWACQVVSHGPGLLILLQDFSFHSLTITSVLQHIQSLLHNGVIGTSYSFRSSFLVFPHLKGLLTGEVGHLPAVTLWHLSSPTSEIG